MENQHQNQQTASLQAAKESVVDRKVSSVASDVQAHPVAQNVKETISSGPVAESLKDQGAKTTSDLTGLKESRKVPEAPAATGQDLTHYHSFFYNLLSWEHPRATAISYAVVVTIIFTLRYLPAFSYFLKALYLILGSTALAEIVGKLVLSHGLTSSFRPKKYYTIPRESLEASLEDLDHLLNFFVIEFQRILFVENIAATSVACLTSLAAYWLIKIVPFWGLSLITVTCVYFLPLIYTTNKELIDENLAHVQQIINMQAAQVKNLAGSHTSHASNVMKQYTSEYTSKAQDLMSSARGPSPLPEVKKSMRSTSDAPSGPISGPGSAPAVTANDFPHAPKQEPVSGVTSHQEQYEKSEFGGQAMPVA